MSPRLASPVRRIVPYPRNTRRRWTPLPLLAFLLAFVFSFLSFLAFALAFRFGLILPLLILTSLRAICSLWASGSLAVLILTSCPPSWFSHGCQRHEVLLSYAFVETHPSRTRRSPRCSSSTRNDTVDSVCLGLRSALRFYRFPLGRDLLQERLELLTPLLRSWTPYRGSGFLGCCIRRWRGRGSLVRRRTPRLLRWRPCICLSGMPVPGLSHPFVEQCRLLRHQHLLGRSQPSLSGLHQLYRLCHLRAAFDVPLD